ncbi:MAG: AAA family ATPase [Pyrinomonadaceae bacterium]
MFLRHRRLNGMGASFEFNSFDLTEACFDIAGIYLPVVSGSRNVYYEAGASQGNSPSQFFRHREGPRQTFLNRIYTGLTGSGPNQPDLFDASDSRLPTTISLKPDWISTLRSHLGNLAILDDKSRSLLTWLLRFGIPNGANSATASIGRHLGNGTIDRNPDLILTPIPTNQRHLRREFGNFLGLTGPEVNQLVPDFPSAIADISTQNVPITFEDLKGAMEEAFLRESEIVQSPSRIIPVESDVSEHEEGLFTQVSALLEDGFAGVIFSGPPGTSKSYYAARIGMRLVENDIDRIRFIQFHPSYQYEDFIEGFVPSQQGIFTLTDKHLLKMCAVAERCEGKLCVLIIDELSRSDPARVFGEALTYIEMTRRGQSFDLASGRPMSIPPNLVFIATMNPMDKGVDDVDAAFERRFAKLAFNPSSEMLNDMLTDNGLEENLRRRVVEFFSHLTRNKNSLTHIGHAYFHRIKDEEGLRRLWNNQLQFQFRKAFPLDDSGFQDLERKWKLVFRPTYERSMDIEGVITPENQGDLNE